jgi:hypothetical protein
MSGSGRWEHLALESIETGLGDSDPALASLLAMFSRLASCEEMPVSERIRTSLRRPPRRGRRRRPSRSAFRSTSALLVWLVVSVALITAAVVLSRGGAPG